MFRKDGVGEKKIRSGKMLNANLRKIGINFANLESPSSSTNEQVLKTFRNIVSPLGTNDLGVEMVEQGKI